MKKKKVLSAKIISGIKQHMSKPVWVKFDKPPLICLYINFQASNLNLIKRLLYVMSKEWMSLKASQLNYQESGLTWKGFLIFKWNIRRTHKPDNFIPKLVDYPTRLTLIFYSFKINFRPIPILYIIVNILSRLGQNWQARPDIL